LLQRLVQAPEALGEVLPLPRGYQHPYLHLRLVEVAVVMHKPVRNKKKATKRTSKQTWVIAAASGSGEGVADDAVVEGAIVSGADSGMAAGTKKEGGT
jgi:hypothetical protein